MPKPVKIDEKELEYQEYQRKQAELEQKEWIESMKESEKCRLKLMQQNKGLLHWIRNLNKSLLIGMWMNQSRVLKMILSHDLLIFLNNNSNLQNECLRVNKINFAYSPSDYGFFGIRP